MKAAILAGCGAEIGANLLIQNDPGKDGFEIKAVVTNPPPVDKHYPELRPIDGIVARLAMALPGIQSSVDVVSDDTLRIEGREVRFYFGDSGKERPPVAGHFDLGFIATSKLDIADDSPVARNMRELASVVLGVAEADDLPSLYGCLADLSSDEIGTIHRTVVDTGMYCLGSCQTNGMHASLRVVVEALKAIDRNARHIVAVETDIVHPDTPNGVLGTRSFEGRMQDARDNLRPSFSQIAKSQHKVMPWAPLVNTVSLRAPVHAPGYQINRFVVNDGGQLNAGLLEAAISRVSEKLGHVVKASRTPLGSRAYAYERRCATIVADANHLLILRPGYLANQGLSEIIIQSFVNNTVGYSAVVRAVARSIALGQPIATFGRIER
ncbi:hypothetical protein [Burkholderia ubonensis]|uniref:hypothetical protein n=1 Tax=Burkholderia ubonensis TaxID=101571 RepID=UPI00075A5334|nr:hypothetical protein [Burkholderia ubonensis]KVG78625.1 hypothetical protein WJ36_23190 [Burkholderia ubonensis]KVP50282.1 hypothetical protein WJ88_17895 [Burkholderia ubonensis]KVP74834.1 hypothetical protein WJ94_20850 [Burkholderia ubonensis]KVR60577.1 hypothetical protein WK19_03565 [Burkholderia ubonensis]KVR65218.1 hypothetical protein WK20_08730 [Burkholderia ubonensis]